MTLPLFLLTQRAFNLVETSNDSVKTVPEKCSLVKAVSYLILQICGIPLIIVSSPLQIRKFLRMRSGRLTCCVSSWSPPAATGLGAGCHSGWRSDSGMPSPFSLFSPLNRFGQSFTTEKETRMCPSVHVDVTVIIPPWYSAGGDEAVGMCPPTHWGRGFRRTPLHALPVRHPRASHLDAYFRQKDKTNKQTPHNLQTRPLQSRPTYSRLLVPKSERKDIWL